MKIKLVENYLIDFSKTKVDIENNLKLIEDISGVVREGSITLKNVPVTKFTENQNGRIYNRKLWENVAKQKMFEGSACYADHREEYSVLDQIGVWQNFRILDEMAVADLVLIGHGKLLEEIVRAKGKVGFSTVGYGELCEDEKTVNPDTYEYNNTDAVTNPSQGTFATFENIIESKKDIKEEKNNNLKKEITNNSDNKFEEKHEVGQMDKIQEASLKNHIRLSLKEAGSSEDKIGSIKDLQELKSLIPAEMVEEINKVNDVIGKIQESLYTEKEAVKQNLEISTKSYDELSQKYESSIKTIKELKENLEKANAVVKKATEGISKEDIIAMKEDVDQFVKDRTLMENDINRLLTEIEMRDKDLNILIEDTELRDKDIKSFMKERKSLRGKLIATSKQLKVAESHIEKLEKILEDDFNFDFDSDPAYPEVIDYDDDTFTGFSGDPVINDVVDPTVVEDEVWSEDYYDDDFVDDWNDDEEIIGNEFNVSDDLNYDVEDDFDLVDDEYIDDGYYESKNKKRPIKEGKKIELNAYVVKFYKEAIEKHPKLRQIKDQILRSGSLKEASQRAQSFLKRTQFSNKTMRLGEDTKKNPVTYEKYVFKRD